MGQTTDIADLISMKTFANSEFCPRFISDENDLTRIGNKLAGKTVVIVSTSSRVVSRQTLAMRTLLIARAAKENGAARVVLVEPDLYYSAQDRGPRRDLGDTHSALVVPPASDPLAPSVVSPSAGPPLSSTPPELPPPPSLAPPSDSAPPLDSPAGMHPESSGGFIARHSS